MFIPREVLKKYPGATCLDEKGNIVRDGYPSKLDTHAFASQEVLKEMQIAVTKAIEYLEKSPYANRIIGYRINGGHTIEWLGWQQKGGVVDFSEASKKGFARFAKVHYPELKDYSIPSAAARRISWDRARSSARDGKRLPCRRGGYCRDSGR